jgi:hypothetical protein
MYDGDFGETLAQAQNDKHDYVLGAEEKYLLRVQ